ncbi:MAG: hypothetical protein K8F91_17140, partial [Candidatus Obscuribacterales bacterium]|nr:hypothetical protein [Candidatus Obscuribacterales bacterium]
STPIPPSFRGTIAHAGLIHDPEQLNANADDEFDLDADIAGEKISGVARGLQTSESLISGFVEPGACLASLDWTFSFTNISKVPREARAKIILPDGAVVTRATMWIDAIEKEATIMPRGLARATYETAVKTHKRDPLLVSMAGKDTILVQCYPVLAGSDTKLKLHIIAPMMSAGENGMSLTLPMFDERNFGFSEAHKISLASSTPITISGTDLKSARNDSGFLLSGNLDNKTISRYEAIIHSERGNNNIAFVDGKSGQSLSLKTDLQRLQLLRPKALIIIVDKSKTVEPYLEQICRGLANLPADMEVSIVSILDQTKLLYKKGDPEKNNLTKALAELKESGCRGGQINAPTIARLLNDFTGSGADLLWIHASQPVAEQVDTSTINYILKSRPDSPRLWNLQVASGPNSAITDDNYSEKLLRVPRTGSLADDISGLFSLWNTKTAEKASKPVLIENEKTSLALSRLARYQQILDLYNNGDRYGSYALAEKYHLITPVSSAVVSDDALVASYEAKFEENGQGLSQAAARRLQTIFGNKIAGVNSAGLNTGRKLSLDSMPELVGKVTDRLDSLSSSAGSAGSIDGYSADYQPTYRPERQALPESKSLDNSIQSKVKSKEGRLEIKTKLGSDHLNFTDSDYQTYADAFNSKSYNQAMPAKQEGAKMSLGGGGGESFQSRREKEREPGMAGGDAADDRSASPPPLLSKDELSTPSSAPVEAFGKGAQEQQIYLNENNIALLDKKSPEPENRQRQFYGKQSNPAPQAATNGTIGTQGQDAMNFDQTPFGATADIADAQPRSGTPSLLKIVFFLLALPASMVVAFLLLRKLIRPEKD